MFICKCNYTSIHREVTCCYIMFSCIRVLLRFITCFTDCLMMWEAMNVKGPSNSAWHSVFLIFVVLTTIICCVLWVWKVTISFTEIYEGRRNRDASDSMSSWTLVGEILKIGFHLLFIWKHAHTYHQNYTGWIIFLSICKLVERIFGICMNYDCRKDEYADDCYSPHIFGVIIKFVFSILLTLV